MFKHLAALFLAAPLAAITIQGPSGDTAASRSASGGPVGGASVSISSSLVSRVVSYSGTTTVTDADKVLERTMSGDTTVSDYVLDTSWTGDPDLDAAWSSLDESVATVSSGGIVTHVSDGSATITMQIDTGTYGINLTLSTNPAAEAEVLQYYASGSAGAGAFDTTKSLADTGGDLAVFTTQNHSTSAYDRNESCWVSSLDWTGVSPWNSNAANRKAGVAITDMHLVHAWHNGYTPPVGTTIRFVLADDSVITREVVGRINAVGDIGIVRLDSALPSGVKTYKILPSTYQSYFPTNYNSALGIVIVSFDQEEKAIARQIFSADTASISHTQADGLASTVISYPLLTENIVSGDSGNPNFMIFGTEPVLLGCHFSAGGFPHLADYITEINAALDTLGPSGYTVQTFDLSGYTNFNP